MQKVINGPIPYSPDGNPYIGPAHGLPNFYQACCFSFGISQSGGAGKTAAEWIAHGEPEWDFWSLDPRRYTDYATKSYVVEKAVELYQNEYAIAFPANEWPAGRPAKTTALYDKLKAKGASFCARGGWERAAWFPRKGDDASRKPSFRRTNWHDAVAEECKAVRERVGILDLGGFTKLVIEGKGANDWLNGMICGKLPKLNRMSLSYMLNDKGGIVSEFTITRLGGRQVLSDVGGCGRMARSRLDRKASAQGQRDPDRQSLGALWLHHHRRAEIARGSDEGHRGGSFQQDLPVAVGAADRDRLCPHASDARELCRRAGLGIACAHGADGADL